MFSLCIKNPQTFVHIFSSLSELINDVTLQIEKKKITINSMDTSHVSLVKVVLKSKKFDEYLCERDNFCVGINLTSMNKVLKCLRHDDELTIQLKESSDVMQFHFKSKNRVSKFEMKLVDIDEDGNMNIPDMDYCLTVRMSSNRFQKICSDFTNFGDVLMINANDANHIEFSLQGDNVNGKLKLKQNELDDESIVLIAFKKFFCGSFTLRYLNIFTKTKNVSDAVTLFFAQDSPMKMKCKTDLGMIAFYLAPKINDIKDC